MTDVVAVTGAEGFIGSHLVEALVQRGCRVRAMVLYNMWNSCAWLDTLDRDVMDHVDVVFGDVRDPASARELVEGAEIVYHLAAIGSVPYSYRAPRSFVSSRAPGRLRWFWASAVDIAVDSLFGFEGPLCRVRATLSRPRSSAPPPSAAPTCIHLGPRRAPICGIAHPWRGAVAGIGFA